MEARQAAHKRIVYKPELGWKQAANGVNIRIGDSYLVEFAHGASGISTALGSTYRFPCSRSTAALAERLVRLPLHAGLWDDYAILHTGSMTGLEVEGLFHKI